MAEFYYRHGPNEFGPLTAAELKEMAHGGRVVRKGEVRRGKTGPWVAAERVQGLFVSASAPPIKQEPMHPPAEGRETVPPPMMFASVANADVELEAAADVEALIEPVELSEIPPDLFEAPASEFAAPEPPAARPLEKHKYPALRTIAQLYEVLGGLLLAVALLGAVPHLIHARNHFDSWMMAVLTTVAAFCGLSAAAVVLFSLGESLKLFIDVEQNTRQTNDLLSTFIGQLRSRERNDAP